MKKFIVAFDGLKFSESVRDYAVTLARQSGAHLVGVFLEDFTLHGYKIYDLITKDGYNEGRQRQLEEKDRVKRNLAVESFETACQQAGLNYSVHHDRSVAIQELVHESIYADLLLIDNRETLTGYTEKIPTDFIRDLLTQTHCPVLIVPHHFKPISKLVLLYDGEASSVHAIKMFSYTLASLKQEPAEVVTIRDLNDSLHVPDNRLIKEFLKRHFPKAVYTVLKGKAESTTIDFLRTQTGNPLIILGAYGRGKVSRWLNPSMADTMMKNLKCPLFIAHNK
jgi:nucleotide-binding universal stress UspA family protein